jgi:hypothetical protein
MAIIRARSRSQLGKPETSAHTDAAALNQHLHHTHGVWVWEA